jgi:hypothetical protein
VVLVVVPVVTVLVEPQHQAKEIMVAHPQFKMVLAVVVVKARLEVLLLLLLLVVMVVLV